MMTGITYRLKQVPKRFLINDQISYQLEMQRMAEFGRVSASLIHDLSTPLTAATLTLDQIKVQQSSDSLMKRARQDLKVLERYVSAARKQLQGESNNINFSLTVAIHQIVMLLSSRAKTQDVKLLVDTKATVRLYGDQIKFNQIMANLINNAIEAYDGIDHCPRIVTISVHLPRPNIVNIVVSDKGIGIKTKDKARIFEPFYSTKHGGDKGLGLGLANVKYYVVNDFNGKITAHYKPSSGTRFIITLPLIK